MDGPRRRQVDLVIPGRPRHLDTSKRPLPRQRVENGKQGATRLGNQQSMLEKQTTSKGKTTLFKWGSKGPAMQSAQTCCQCKDPPSLRHGLAESIACSTRILDQLLTKASGKWMIFRDGNTFCTALACIVPERGLVVRNKGKAEETLYTTKTMLEEWKKLSRQIGMSQSF